MLLCSLAVSHNNVIHKLRPMELMDIVFILCIKEKIRQGKFSKSHYHECDTLNLNFVIFPQHKPIEKYKLVDVSVFSKLNER